MCNTQGSVNIACDETGVCACKDTYTGDKCGDCAAEHYNIANSCNRKQNSFSFFHWNSQQFFLLACECNESGSVDQNCDAQGKCTCKENVTGDKCDVIVPGHFDIDDPKGMI